MIEKVRFDQIADIFTGVRVKRYQKGKGTTVERPILKKTYSENSSKLDLEYEEVSEGIHERFYSQKNDIVVLLAGSVVTKLEKEGIIIPMYYAVVRVREGFDADFIYQLLKSDIFPKELHKLQEGSTLKVIKTTHLKQICLPLPDYETQRKYGNLFRLMDDRINKNLELIELERKKEKLIMKNLLDELGES